MTDTLQGDQLALLAAICVNPGDDTVRLVYANWLEESGQGERAEFCRVQVELSHTPEPALLTIGPLIGRATKKHRFGGTCMRCTDEVYCTYHGLVMREKELFPCVYRDNLPGPFVPNLDGHVGRDAPHAHYRRGFVEGVTCTAAEWLAHADAMLWHPDQKGTCGRCEGDGKAHGADRPFEWSPDVTYGKCVVCKGSGKGTVPRPFPATAQPITRVTLTMMPYSIIFTDSADDTIGVLRRPGRHKRFDVSAWAWKNCDGNWTRAVCEMEWPGVTFDIRG